MSVPGKSLQAFRTIAEASGELDVPAHVLRFWEGKFPQLRPLKRAGGRRHYRPDDMALLRGIRALLQEDGYQLKGVQKLLREEGISWVRDRGHLAQSEGGDAQTRSQPSQHEAPPPVKNRQQQIELGPLFEEISQRPDLDGTNPAVGILLRKALAKLENAHAILSLTSQNLRSSV